MEIALNASLFLGTVLLVGAGITARWVSPEARSAQIRRWLAFGLALGAALLVIGSLGDVFMTVTRILRGRFEAGLFLDYLLTTRHGQAVLVRLGLTFLLAAWGTRTLMGRFDRPLYALASLGLLATLSLVSHSGVMGVLPFVGDLVHLVGATLWAGSLLYFAALPIWSRHDLLVLAVRRVSAVGMTSVGLIALTGLYLATLHLFGLRALSTTAYGLALVVKVALVLVILAIAGVNRWVLVPRLERGESRPLRLAVRLEAVLLVSVLFATGVLTTREPPHGHNDHGGHAATHGTTHSVTQDADQDTPESAHPAHPGATSPGGTEPANRFDLATGPVTAEPLLTAEGGFSLVLTPAPEEDPRGDGAFTAALPDGTRHPLAAERAPTHHGHEELWLELPSPQTGSWQLLGPAGEALSFTVHASVLESGARVTALFLPTPSLAGGGLSEVFVYAYEEGAADERPLFIAYRMPGMEHASDDERFELEAGEAYHDARAHARRASLSFPMVGEWEVELLFEGEEVERQHFTLEVLAD